MSSVDTTSFARILLGAMGQGADIFNRASSGAQSIVDSQQNRAFRERAFAADQEQRAFGNNLATQDQAIQQAAADRAAQAFPLSQKMAQSQLDAAQFQFAQQQQKAEEDAMIGSILAPRVANKILELSAAKYGAPRFDDQMRAFAVTNGKVSADGMSYLLRNLNEASDLDKLQTVAKKNRSMIESTLRSSGATPEMKAQGEGLLAMLESENPNTLREALRSAGQFQQQQAAQAERVGLVGAMQSAGPLSPEQQLAIQGDPSLRRIFEQVNQPAAAAAPDPAMVAQLFTRMQQGDTAARAQLIQLGQITPSAAFGPPRDTSAADAEKRRDQMWQDSQRLEKAATDAKDAGNTVLADQLFARARQLQQQVVSGMSQSQQTEPMLLSEMEKERTKEAMRKILADFRRANGRNPTDVELEQLTIQQASQPQRPR